jgi:hypothetical protein
MRRPVANAVRADSMRSFDRRIVAERSPNGYISTLEIYRSPRRSTHDGKHRKQIYEYLPCPMDDSDVSAPASRTSLSLLPCRPDLSAVLLWYKELRLARTGIGQDRQSGM